MPQRNANPKHSDEVREAIKAAIDAIAEYHGVVAASNAEVVAKITQVARALGWPDHVVSGVVQQLQSTAEMQIKMIDHTLEVWREQITSWPSLTSEGHWPDAGAFKAMSVNPSSSGHAWGSSGRRIGHRR